jgi:thiol-disulfide isomerase/thioredoxin
MKFLLSTVCLLVSVSGFAQLQNGTWRMELSLNDSTKMPFRFEVLDNTVTFINDEEQIKAESVVFEGDSVYIKMPIFDSEFRMQMDGRHTYMKGNFINHSRTSKNITPARAGLKTTTDVPAEPTFNIAGKWEVHFAGDEPPLDLPIGEFKQNGTHVTGTFLTSTGDYRYLEGTATRSWFEMSAFDGSHVFYFNGTYQDDGSINGNFYSGMHWHDTWTASRASGAMMPNPDSLTFLKPGFDKLAFSFPDLDSNLVSLSDKRFQNKVVIVQVMGTWCPNCMDETKFLAPYYSKHKAEGLEIIGLDYEKIVNFSTAKNNLGRLKNYFGIDYPLLFAGSADKKEASKTLPMMTEVLAFPTTIFIDRKGRVRKIHTGFSGPATGAGYEKWKDDFTGFTEKLLKEK